MLAALLFITNGIAQVQLGLQAGANFADVTQDPTQEGVEISMRTGFLIGGILFYSFSPILGLQVEPAYVQKGAKLSLQADPTPLGRQVFWFWTSDPAEESFLLVRGHEGIEHGH